MLPDVLLAAVLTGLGLAAVYGGTDGRVQTATVVLTVLALAPLALRQWAPSITMAISLVALAVHALVGDGSDIASGGIALVVAMFTVATMRPRRTAALMFTAALAVVTVYLASLDDVVPWTAAVQTALVLLGAWVLGESTRRWAQHAERTAAQAARAVADERVRIARELHDIVAHHMSVIALQAGLAEYVLDADSPTAKSAIATVGSASREALSDLRRMLDVLRLDTDGEPDLGPQPGLALLDELVERTRRAGLSVDVVVTGRPRPLPPGPDLCAYRVVQEALTNVLKHAGAATARVEVDHGEQALTVQVSDTGAAPSRQALTPPSVTPPSVTPPSVTPPSSGHGLRGMRERAALYGGELATGPLDGGGFAVVLRLPREQW